MTLIRLVLFVALALGGAYPPGLIRGAEIDFNRDVRHLLSDNCFTCHGPDSNARKAGLRLDIRDEAILNRDGVTAVVPGDSGSSELVRRLFSDDPDDRMPPPDSNFELTETEKQTLVRWIDAGAEYDDHWSFVSLRLPPSPPVDREAPVRNPIDRFVLARLEREGLSFAEAATKEKLIRRVTFDLTGLPPTLSEIDTFLQDQSPDAYERLVDRLLRRESYGERLASEWLDVARYSDTYGYQVDRDRHVWPWRDWVIGAFNRNLPYDQFVTWQLAGDLLSDADDEQILATTFNRLHPQKVEGGSVPEEFRIEYVSDRVHTFATAFLGLTMECARCHDHKYDPISQKEYYQLTAFFANVDEAGLYSYFTPAAVPTPTLLLADENQKRQMLELDAKIVNAEQELDSIVAGNGVGFEAWLDSRPTDAEIPGRLGRFRFDRAESNKMANEDDAEKPAESSPANQIVSGKYGNAIQLSGDDEVRLKLGNFARYQPFTISLWMNVPKRFERAVVFHRSRAWTDAASRGYQLLIEEGKLSASLIHFWPGNAIRVATRGAVPIGEWVHTTMTYDGSSRARGLRIYINGERAETELIRDNLYKNITGGGGNEIAIGARFRDVGFKGGRVDEFQVFDRELTPIQVAQLHDGKSLSEALVRPRDLLTEAQLSELKAFFSVTFDSEFQQQIDVLQKLRRQRSELTDPIQEIMVMREMLSPRPAYLLKRGAYDARTEEVYPKAPSVFPKFSKGAPPNRLGLARWLTDPAHPLTARVTVNRYWQMIFGKGLVQTPEDFGSQGKPPTHPDLLDWLAVDFIDHGWDLKRLVRIMVTSTVYRQSSQPSAEVLARDPENALLARAPRYRWPAEMIRDNALAVSGLLVPEIGGPPVKPYEIAESFKASKPDEGDGLYRRSLYTYWRRTGPAPVMMALDAAKRDVCAVRRESTATPLQAFVFMNDPQFVEAARRLAERSLDVTDGNPHNACDRIFRMLTSRVPNSLERDVLHRLYNEQLAMFENEKESATQFLATGKAKNMTAFPVSQLAAMTVVANALLSHDECVMKR